MTHEELFLSHIAEARTAGLLVLKDKACDMVANEAMDALISAFVQIAVGYPYLTAAASRRTHEIAVFLQRIADNRVLPPRQLTH